MKVRDLRTDAFNLIAAGCGTGKTYWVINNLANELPNVKPYEIAFVTSRSITKEQQSRNKGTTKLRRDDPQILSFWNNELKDDESVLEDYGVLLLTYDQIIRAVNAPASERGEVLKNLKVVVFDECHVLFSDAFISGLGSLHMWIREVIYGKNRKLLIGMSATTSIVEKNSDTWGVPINRINSDVVSGYQAKQLVCTNFDTIPYLISANKLPGKTIVMCFSIDHCQTLVSRLSNATYIVSPHTKEFTPEMKRIRDHIIKYEELPPTFFDAEGNERDLEVLVATSTLREGFNLRESSGVRNVITCMTDDLNVIQFAGRCRYSFDNLVVADSLIYSERLDRDPYMKNSRRKFRDYLRDKNQTQWFEPIAHLVSHDIYGVKRFILGSDANRFIGYINSHWLVPAGLDKSLQLKYRIWRDEDKKEIIGMADKCQMFDLYKSEITFNRVVRLLEQSLGYDVDSGRAVMDGQRQIYKLVIGYDADAATYTQRVPTLADGISI